MRNKEWEQEFDALTAAHDALVQQKTELETALATAASERVAVQELLDKAEKNLAILRGAAGRANTLKEQAAELETRIAELHEQHRTLTDQYDGDYQRLVEVLQEQCALRSVETPYYGGAPHFNLFRPSDPTSLQSVTYIGRGERRVHDRRTKEWITINAYLFNVNYGHAQLEFRVNPEFGSKEAARGQVDNYAPALGRIPALLLSRGQNVSINDGPGAFGGSWHWRTFTITAGSGEVLMRRGGLEEVFIHEGVHVSLDGAHRNSAGWRQAQLKDCVFISSYARDHPDREDLAESFLAWFALRYYTERLTASDRAAILNAIPNRLAYFDEQEFDVSLPGSG